MDKFYINYDVGYEEDDEFSFSGCIEVDDDVFKEGTKKDFLKHNRDVAYQYIKALENEEFDELEDFCVEIINKILLYIDKDEKYDYYKRSLRDGSFLTSRGRTLIDAILDKKNTSLAIMYALSGVKDMRLLALYVMYKDINYNEEASVFSNIFDFPSAIKYQEYCENILKCIDEFYGLIDNDEEKISVLKRVAEALKQARHPSKFGEVKISLSHLKCEDELKKNLTNNLFDKLN